ncbi:MAG: branched-chain amino acid ABC transporter permease [Eubacteriaceae bacterium]
MKKSYIMTIIFLTVSIIIPFFSSSFMLHILNLAIINIILASGLNILLGYTGEFPLCQAAFFGLGAYCTALLSTNLNLSFILSLFLTIIFLILFSFLAGLILCRVTAQVFVLMSLSFQNVIYILVLKLINITNGPNGIVGIPFPRFYIPLIGEIQIKSLISNYFFMLIFLLSVLYIVNRIFHSNLGNTLMAIRESHSLSRSIGINIYKYKIISFMFMALISGVAGILYAHYIGLISPAIITFQYSLLPLIMVALGGYGNLSGPIIGAIFMTLIPEYLRMISPFFSQYRLVVLGMILIFCVFSLPKGLIGLVDTSVIRKLQKYGGNL